MRNMFKDGVRSLFNSLMNQRDATTTNAMFASRLSREEMRQYYLSGIGSKIIRLKSSYALDDSLIFNSDIEENFYKDMVEEHLLKAIRYMLGFGRGIILVFNEGDDLSTELRQVDTKTTLLRSFSGDSVTVSNISSDLSNERYFKPLSYNVFGNEIHYSRVIDFTYYEPPEEASPAYRYGGVSEFELIHDSLLADGIVHRAGANIIDRSANLIYKIKGFNSLLETKRSDAVEEYVAVTEKFRSIAGGTIIDSENDISSISQTIPNYSDIETSMLRRVATVTSIPYPILVGETVKGLNSTGEQERQSFNDMLRALQREFIIRPLNKLLSLFDLSNATFSESQGITPVEKVNYEKIVIENAINLDNMQEDGNKYLIEKGVIVKDDYAAFFNKEDKEKAPNSPIELFRNPEENDGVEND